MTNVYSINKGVNRPVVFRGLKAHYIWWLAGGLLCALLLFAVMYILGVPMIMCSLLVGVSITLHVMRVYKLNRLYGEHGWMKTRAKRVTPNRIYCDQLFTK
ncbi:MAG: DUF4133 domain-containing protein [Bacteroidota bacterium]